MNCASLPNVCGGLPYVKALNKLYIQRILMLYFKPNSRSNGKEEKGQFDSVSDFQLISTEL